jgi:hypothetical protein
MYGLSGLFFVGECLARIAVILVKTAKLIQSPRPAHVFGGGRVGVWLVVGGRESNRLTQVGVLGPISIHSPPGRLKEMGRIEGSLESFNSDVKKKMVSGIGEYAGVSLHPRIIRSKTYPGYVKPRITPNAIYNVIFV